MHLNKKTTKKRHESLIRLGHIAHFPFWRIFTSRKTVFYGFSLANSFLGPQNNQLSIAMFAIRLVYGYLFFTCKVCILLSLFSGKNLFEIIDPSHSFFGYSLLSVGNCLYAIFVYRPKIWDHALFKDRYFERLCNGSCRIKGAKYKFTT